MQPVNIEFCPFTIPYGFAARLLLFKDNGFSEISDGWKQVLNLMKVIFYSERKYFVLKYFYKKKSCIIYVYPDVNEGLLLHCEIIKLFCWTVVNCYAMVHYIRMSTPIHVSLIVLIIHVVVPVGVRLLRWRFSVMPWWVRNRRRISMYCRQLNLDMWQIFPVSISKRGK